jgi:hypothetical protein
MIDINLLVYAIMSLCVALFLIVSFGLIIDFLLRV